jgi:tRNA(Arg) A34 adenosine deaminase TadA
MDSMIDIGHSWAELPVGARAALNEQWRGLAAGGLACGSSIVDAEGRAVGSGRNHVYDPAGPIETRLQYALQHNRLAHAELNALADIATETDHELLTIWSTQYPCSMCASALAFVGIGKVVFIADDLSDDSSADTRLASRGSLPYEAFGSTLWWVISNLLFLHNPVLLYGTNVSSFLACQSTYPRLAELVVELVRDDELRTAAKAGKRLHEPLARHSMAIVECVAQVERNR